MKIKTALSTSNKNIYLVCSLHTSRKPWKGKDRKKEGKRRGKAREEQREGGSFTCSGLRAQARGRPAAAPQGEPTQESSRGCGLGPDPSRLSPDLATAPLHIQQGPLRLPIHWQVCLLELEHHPGGMGCCPLSAGPPKCQSLDCGLFYAQVLVQVPAQYHPPHRAPSRHHCRSAHSPETPDIPTSKLPCEARTGVSCPSGIPPCELRASTSLGRPYPGLPLTVSSAGSEMS